MYNVCMENLTFIIAAGVFFIIFFGPHTKSSKPKDDKKGGDKGKK